MNLVEFIRGTILNNWVMLETETFLHWYGYVEQSDLFGM